MTLAEQRQALETLEELRRFRERVLAERGGKLFPPAWKDIRAERRGRE
jgi:hypothetical protein